METNYECPMCNGSGGMYYDAPSIEEIVEVLRENREIIYDLLTHCKLMRPDVFERIDSIIERLED